MKRAFSAWLIAGLLFLTFFIAGHFVASGQPGADHAVRCGRSSRRAICRRCGLQNRQQYELAAEEWSQFLKWYPQDGVAPREPAITLGLCQLKNQQYAAAAQTFSALVARPISSTRRSEGRPRRGREGRFAGAEYLYLGLAQYNAAQAAAGDPPSNSNFVSRRHNRSPAWCKNIRKASTWRKACSTREKWPTRKARNRQAAAAYAQVVERFPRDELAPDALYALGVTQEELGQAARPVRPTPRS